MVEIAQDDEDPATLRAESVFDWHADVIESDIGCARSRRVGRLDGLGRDAFLTGNEDDCQAILSQRYPAASTMKMEIIRAHLGSAPSCEAVICEHAIFRVEYIPAPTSLRSCRVKVWPMYLVWLEI